MNYGKTALNQKMPWGLYTRNGHKVLCADGKIRACEMSPTADTFFSVPARARINGKWVSGYVTGEEQKYIEKVKTEEPFLKVWAFRAHNESNPEGFPQWSELTPEKHNELIENAHAFKWASFERFEIKLPAECVKDCNHSGDCSADVDQWQPKVSCYLSHISDEKLSAELREYGSWNNEELKERETNEKRIIRIAAGNIQEEDGQ